jgi:RNA polymerase sigma-70 factor (ECF subfamily)
MSAATMSQPKLTRDLLEHRQALLGFIYALTRDFDAADEIFQETALTILAEAAAGRQPVPFLPWAREIARNRFLEYCRNAARNRRTPAVSPELLDIVAQSFNENETNDISHVRQSHLAECLETLTERVRHMLKERYYGTKSIAEIARDAGWTPDSVHVALSRARKALADCITRRANLKGAR